MRICISVSWVVHQEPALRAEPLNHRSATKEAQLAAKTRRLILEMGGDLGLLDVEWSTGSVWYNEAKALNPKPSSGDRQAARHQQKQR